MVHVTICDMCDRRIVSGIYKAAIPRGNQYERGVIDSDEQIHMHLCSSCAEYLIKCVDDKRKSFKEAPKT